MTDIGVAQAAPTGRFGVAAKTAKVVAVMGIAMIAVRLAEAIPALGRNIPGPDIDVDYLIAIGVALVLGISILVWPVRHDDRGPLLVLWAAKCAVALGVMLFYEAHYSLDAFAYFGFATFWRSSSEPLAQAHFGAGSDNVRFFADRIGTVLPSYHAMKLFFAMAGLVAIYILYRAAVRYMGREDKRILYLLGLYPSIIFWSSILGKDPLQLVGIAVYVFGVVSWVRRRRLIDVLIVALGISIAASIRLWAAPIMLFPLVGVVWDRRMSPVARGFLAVALMFAMVVALRRFADQYRLNTIDDLRTIAEATASGWGGGGSSVQNDLELATTKAVLMYLPLGMATALFRPLPGEILNPFGLLSGLENLLLLVLTLFALRHWRRAPIEDPVFRWALMLVLTWAGVYAFIAFNLGSIVRFKLQIYPVMLLLLMYLASLGRGAKRPT
jgi:hypothetical protein